MIWLDDFPKDDLIRWLDDFPKDDFIRWLDDFFHQKSYDSDESDAEASSEPKVEVLNYNL